MREFSAHNIHIVSRQRLDRAVQLLDRNQLTWNFNLALGLTFTVINRLNQMYTWEQIVRSRRVREVVERRFGNAFPAKQSARREHPVFGNTPSIVRPHPVSCARWISRNVFSDIRMVADRQPKSLDDVVFTATRFFDHHIDEFRGPLFERRRFRGVVGFLVIELPQLTPFVDVP